MGPPGSHLTPPLAVAGGSSLQVASHLFLGRICFFTHMKQPNKTKPKYPKPRLGICQWLPMCFKNLLQIEPWPNHWKNQETAPPLCPPKGWRSSGIASGKPWQMVDGHKESALSEWQHWNKKNIGLAWPDVSRQSGQVVDESLPVHTFTNSSMGMGFRTWNHNSLRSLRCLSMFQANYIFLQLNHDSWIWCRITQQVVCANLIAVPMTMCCEQLAPPPAQIRADLLQELHLQKLGHTQVASQALCHESSEVCLVVGWVSTPLQNMSSSIGMIIPNSIWKNNEK